MKYILSMIGRILIFTLHYGVLRPLSFVVAVVVGVCYWLIWLIIKPFKSKKPQEEIKLPGMDDLSKEISVESLIGPKAEMKIDAVFEGGGVKALAQIGAVQAVESLKLGWNLLGGTSGGAIVASLLAAEKKSEDIWELLTETGLHSFVEVPYLPRIGFLQKRLYFLLPLFAHLMWARGMVSGKKFQKTMEKYLKKDNDEPFRFKDFPSKDPKKAPYYRLKMVATDISRGTPIILPDDLPYYWEAWDKAEKAMKKASKPVGKLETKDAQDWWPVAEAVRMSMSIPFFFNPVLLHLNVGRDGKPTKDEKGRRGKQVLIVDGGVSSNFPIWLFDRLNKIPDRPTFGFLLDESKGIASKPPRVTRFLTDLAISVIGTGIGAMDKRMSDHDIYRTAKLQTMGVGTTEFGLSLEEQKQLVESGFYETRRFFKEQFKWQEYLDQFRR